MDISKTIRLKGEWARYGLHLLFWMFMYVFFIYVKMPLMGLSPFMTAVVVLKDLVVIAAIFYFLNYYVVSHILLKRRYLLFILLLVAVYYFYALTVYLDFVFTPKLVNITSRGYLNYSNRVLSAGLWGLLRLQNVAEILFDLSYLLSPALIVKLLLTLLKLSTQASNLQRDNVNLELAFLKSQINPHFLFNTLNNVYSLALHKSDKTAEIILKLSNLMRYTLYESNTSTILLSEEIAFLQNYVELESLRHSNKVTISFDIEGDYENLTIAPLIIFPFIENGFKHGINASAKTSWVTIKLSVREGVLRLLVSNSNFLKKKTARKTVGGIGIANTKKRLELLYSGAYELNIDETEAYFSIDVSMHLK